MRKKKKRVGQLAERLKMFFLVVYLKQCLIYWERIIVRQFIMQGI